MICATEGPWGESRDEGVIITYFLGLQGIARYKGGDCENFVSCGKILHGIKGDYFNYRALLL